MQIVVVPVPVPRGLSRILMAHKSNQHLCNFPNMAGWIRKSRSAPSPWSINRPVQQSNATILKLRADGVHVIDLDREQNTRPSGRRRYRHGLYQWGRIGSLKKIDHSSVKLQHAGHLVLVNYSGVKDL